MSPRVLRLEETPADEALAAFADTARAGGLLIFPTDTVYGLGARADRDQPVQRIYEAKGRPGHLALPVLAASTQGARRAAAEWSPAAQALAEAVWPGPLTIVVPAWEGLSPLVTAGRGTVGLRVPDYPPLRGWLAACEFPVAVTSANRSGEAAATEARELPPELREAVDLLLDGGFCPGSTPSTVVDVTSSPPRVLRTGPITEQDILRALAKFL